MTDTTQLLASEPRTTEQGEKWCLRLYVAGRTPRCITALRNLERFCEEQLAGRYEIEVVDLLENPYLAKDDQIIAIPTLVRRRPEPLRKIIGNLSDTDRMRSALT